MPFSTEIRENRAMVAEIKFFVPSDRVDVLRDWARARLGPDPYGSGPFGDTYHTNSLYFDTRDFDVFHRRGSYGRSKYRVRRYGDAVSLFFERKLKTHDHVSKRRSVVGIRELPRLESPEPVKGWPGHWFHRRMLARELGVVGQVAYDRTALVHTNGHGPIRMTLDRNVRAIASNDLAFRSLDGEPSLIGGDAILELKFYRALPPVFEELIAKFSLTACPISKYRIAIKHLRLAPDTRALETAQ
jgi:hypothetical protein